MDELHGVIGEGEPVAVRVEEEGEAAVVGGDEVGVVGVTGELEDGVVVERLGLVVVGFSPAIRVSADGEDLVGELLASRVGVAGTDREGLAADEVPTGEKLFGDE